MYKNAFHFLLKLNFLKLLFVLIQTVGCNTIIYNFKNASIEALVFDKEYYWHLCQQLYIYTIF